MNIVCDKVLLSAAIDGVSKAVTMRSAIPVLEGILLKAEGFQLNLTGYDLEMGIVTTIEANVTEAGVPTEDLPYGVVKEWRDGFYIALNYTSDIQEIAIPDEAEILIGSARLEPAGVVVWKEKSDDRHK